MHYKEIKEPKIEGKKTLNKNSFWIIRLMYNILLILLY